MTPVSNTSKRDGHRLRYSITSSASAAASLDSLLGRRTIRHDRQNPRPYWPRGLNRMQARDVDKETAQRHAYGGGMNRGRQLPRPTFPCLCPWAAVFLWQNHTGFKTRDDASENSPTISGSEKTLAMARLAFGLQKFFVGPC